PCRALGRQGRAAEGHLGLDGKARRAPGIGSRREGRCTQGEREGCSCEAADAAGDVARAVIETRHQRRSETARWRRKGTMGLDVETVLMWLFVSNPGGAFGAGVCEGRVVVSMWTQ